MIRLFIGTSSNGEDRVSEAVYEYTLRKNASEELDIVWMRQTHDKTSFWHGFDTHNWPTPFSGYRWAIPEYCNFQGRAIYTDEDMINFRDIKELWDVDLGDKPLGARKGTRFGGHEFCVTVIDCAKFKGFNPAEEQRRDPVFHQKCIQFFSGNTKLVHEIDPRWNCLDGENRDVQNIWQLHWTSMPTQPWEPAWFTGQTAEHPRKDLVDLFWFFVEEANKNGYNGLEPENPPVKYDIIGR